MQDFLKIYREALLFVLLGIILIFAGIQQIKPKINEFISNRSDIIQKKVAIENIDKPNITAINVTCTKE